MKRITRRFVTLSPDLFLLLTRIHATWMFRQALKGKSAWSEFLAFSDNWLPSFSFSFFFFFLPSSRQNALCRFVGWNSGILAYPREPCEKFYIQTTMRAEILYDCAIVYNLSFKILEIFKWIMDSSFISYFLFLKYCKTDFDTFYNTKLLHVRRFYDNCVIARVTEVSKIRI